MRLIPLTEGAVGRIVARPVYGPDRQRPLVQAGVALSMQYIDALPRRGIERDL